MSQVSKEESYTTCKPINEEVLTNFARSYLNEFTMISMKCHKYRRWSHSGKNINEEVLTKMNSFDEFCKIVFE